MAITIFLCAVELVNCERAKLFVCRNGATPRLRTLVTLTACPADFDDRAHRAESRGLGGFADITGDGVIVDMRGAAACVAD